MPCAATVSWINLAIRKRDLHIGQSSENAFQTIANGCSLGDSLNGEDWDSGGDVGVGGAKKGLDFGFLVGTCLLSLSMGSHVIRS
jgi:hypothetical protein